MTDHDSLEPSPAQMGETATVPPGEWWPLDDHGTQIWVYGGKAVDIAYQVGAEGELQRLRETVERMSRRLLHTSQHNKSPIFIGGRIQDDINELRRAAGLPEFAWGDSVPDAEVGRCTVHSEGCAGQETHP